MTECVIIASEGMTADVLEQATEVCRSVGVDVVRREDAAARVEMGAQANPSPITAIVASLPPGARRVPDRVAALAEQHNARVILLAAEPLVRPVVTLSDGALVIVSPPFDRPRLVGAVRGDRALALADGSLAADARSFENLRRACWVSWQRGADGLLRVDAHHPEAGALTAVVLLTADGDASAAAVARVIDEVATDSRCEAQLWSMLGIDAAVIRLTPSADQWLVYWPRPEHPLTLSSPHRLPTRWSIAATLGSAKRRMARLPAYPGDLLVALIDPDPGVARAIDAEARFLAGGPDARATLAGTSAPRLTSLLVEVR